VTQSSDLCRRGWSLRIFNQLFEATHKVFVPHKVIRGQRVFIIATPVFAEFGGGGRSTVLPWSHPSGPFHGLLLGKDNFGLPWVWQGCGAWRLWRSGCGCTVHTNVAHKCHFYVLWQCNAMWLFVVKANTSPA